MASELFEPTPERFSDTPPALSAKSQLEAAFLLELTGFLVARRLNGNSSGCFYISGALSLETLQSLLMSVRPDW
ncbi:MAG: hypothetical protein KME26_32240 [Oscillatoria princeps RMCB-10]|jgi:hypothetical protein|nr:hypothetical protein [Oscillatoria princeps RMCB-10]